MNIVPLQENGVEELSEFLIQRFKIPRGDRHFVSPEVLRWKHLHPRHKWTNSTSFIARNGGKIIAHVGVTPTEILCPGRRSEPVPAYYPMEWAADPGVPMAGTVVLLHALSLPGVQYSYGSTAAGLPVLLRCGFRSVTEGGVYYQVYNWHKPAVWNFIHGRQKVHMGAAMLGLDLPRAIFRPRRRVRHPNITLRRAAKFESDPVENKDVAHSDLIFTSRAPGLLNYFLTFPGPYMTGWHIEHDGTPIGHGLLNMIERGGVRRGVVVDCFLYSRDVELWTGAIWALTQRLRDQQSDLVRCYGASPWVREALRRNGFFRRGRQTIYIRDPQNQLPESGDYYLTDIEGDSGY